jgi:hypothetical protein
MWLAPAPPPPRTLPLPRLACVPTGMLACAMFLVVWKLLPARLPAPWALGRRLSVMVLASLSLWASIAVCVVVLRSLVVTNTGSAVAVGIAGCSLHVLVSPAVAAPRVLPGVAIRVTARLRVCVCLRDAL